MRIKRVYSRMTINHQLALQCLPSTSQSLEVFIKDFFKLTLTVLVATIDAQWEGMGDVGSARYEPALHVLPPCPIIRVLSYSNYM